MDVPSGPHGTCVETQRCWELRLISIAPTSRATSAQHVHRARLFTKRHASQAHFGRQMECLKSTLERDAAPACGDEKRRVLGHVALVCLVRRPLLIVLSSLYIIIDKTGSVRLWLWWAVDGKLRIMRLLFAVTDIEAEFPSRGFATVACRTRYGVMELEWKMSDGEISFRSGGFFTEATLWGRPSLSSPSPYQPCRYERCCLYTVFQITFDLRQPFP